MTAVASEATSLLPPLTDSIVTAVSRLLDDRDNRRDPSHSDLRSHISRAGLSKADPTTPCGKEKRVRAILGWAIEHDEGAGRVLIGFLISEIRGCGGFRQESENFVGAGALGMTEMPYRTRRSRGTLRADQSREGR